MKLNNKQLDTGISMWCIGMWLFIDSYNLQDSAELATQHDKRCTRPQSLPVFMIKRTKIKMKWMW